MPASLEFLPLPAGMGQAYQQIIANPDDDLPRLIYADWLDERGDPRGEFIRLQIARTRLEELVISLVTGEGVSGDLRCVQVRLYQVYVELRQRENLLLKQYRAEWLAPFRGLTSGEEFRRGFVESVKIAARTFLQHASRLFALTPIRHVQILDLDAWADSLAACPFLDRLEALTIHAQHSGPALATALARSPYLSGLRRLCLSRNRLGDEGLNQLASRPWPNLEVLDLSHNYLSSVVATILQKRRRHFPRLHSLQLGNNNLGPNGSYQLTDGPLVRQLVFLGLAGNQIGQDSKLSSLRSLLTLPELDLSNNGLSACGLQALLIPAIAPHGPLGELPSQIRLLKLSRNQLGDAGARLLANACCFPELQTLHLAGCNIRDAGAQALAAGCFPKLHTLDLSNNPIGSEGFSHFIDPYKLRLTKLRYLLRTASTLPPNLNYELERRFPLLPNLGVGPA
ncbi:MAG: TIGR02996 domain-containing protein [Thermogemmata sp.]|nr:TIGR02996 domain-containing protein [Thermogemmata sp.]